MGDEAALARAPGIGKKTAQRVVLELKDKMEPADLTTSSQPPSAAAVLERGAQQEAVQALIALGFNSAEAARAINQVRDQGETTNHLVMLALRSLGGPS
jgi:Holliday junction DNA helicase RuvA